MKKRLLLQLGIYALATGVMSFVSAATSSTMLLAQSLYIMPKYHTRSRIAHAQMAHRGDANLRQKQAQATNAPPSQTNSPVISNAGANAANQGNNTSTNAFPYYSSIPQQRPLTSNSRTNVANKPKVAPKTDTDAPRSLPISEASGPLYNDRDPLLNYQREQAAKGNPESQYALGVRYLTGNGVEQSDELARQWLEKASAQGNLKARSKLRELAAE